MEKFEKAWFFDNGGSYAICVVADDKGEYIFKGRKYILSDEEISASLLAHRSMVSLKLIFEKMQSIVDVESEDFKILSNKFSEICLKHALNENFEDRRKYLINKTVSLINKINTQCVLLFETLGINYESYNLKKKAIITELFSLIEAISKIAYYLTKYDFNYKNRDDENTFDEWKEFCKFIRENNVVSKNEKFMSIIDKGEKAILDLKDIRKKLVHNESVIVVGKGKRYKQYSIDYMISDSSGKSIRKLRFIAEGESDLKNRKSEILRDVSNGEFVYESTIDIYELMEDVTYFSYFWLNFLFNKNTKQS